MAEPSVIRTPQRTAAGDPKTVAPQLAAVNDFLRHYTPSAASDSTRDVLDKRWRVELAVPLPEFDTRTARAFAATDLNEAEKKYYALVCRPGTYQRHRAIAALKALRHPNILPLMAAGMVEMSQPQEERFVIFHERPAGKKLSELMAATKGDFNEHFLCREIIAPLADAIHQLSQLGIAHGRINPDNVYYLQAPILGDCVSEPCGYSQPFHFEPLERLQAMPAGKGEGSAAQDYYALAILVLQLQHGSSHFDGLTPETLARRILREGGYTALMRDKETSALFDEFFRGLLIQNAHDRWDYSYLKPWLDGKRFNVLLPPAPSEAMRPFEIFGTEAHTRRELAHVLFTNWPRVAELLTGGQLAQWISVSLRDKTLAENAARIAKSIKEIGSKNDIQVSEQIMRFLLLLDPAGPVRFATLSMHVDGVDSLAAELFAGRAEADLQALAKFAELGMAGFWTEQQRKDPEYEMSPAVNAALMKLDRLRLGMRNTGLGFGLERLLYELNPEMPCLSPLLAGGHVVSLPALLKRLDRMSHAQAMSHDPVDRHIAAFVGSRLNIQHEVRLHELEVLPELAMHRSVLSLRILGMAQQRSTDMLLPGLAHWLASRILPLLENLRSRTLRDKLATMVVERARAGNLPYLAELIIDSNYASADRDGYGKAMSAYRTNAAEILSLRKGEFLDQKSDLLGAAIAKLIGSAALVLVLLSLAANIR